MRYGSHARSAPSAVSCSLRVPTRAEPPLTTGTPPKPRIVFGRQIFVNANQPYDGAQGRAWGAALTLIAIAFILMIAARIVTARFTRYSR